MKRGDNMSIMLLAACVVAIVLAVLLIGYTYGLSVAAVCACPAVTIEPITRELSLASTSTPTPQQVIPDGSIAIPGFERLTVQGNSLDATGIHNPARNACYFVVSLLLENGTEIYRSEILSPGQFLGIAELKTPLAPGIYERAIIRYSCFALETMQPLNGADITFTLEVLP
jgi:hypothetical protein